MQKKDREMNINGQNIFLKGIRNEHIPQEPEGYPPTLPVVRNLASLELSPIRLLGLVVFLFLGEQMLLVLLAQNSGLF